jgi:inorganic pyrophosphatase
MATELPESVLVRIEVPRGGIIKRELHGEGSIDYISPIPSPFNYGFVPGSVAEDGDPVDAVVLGKRLGVGDEVTLPVVAYVRFVDAGMADHKLVVSEKPLSNAQLARIKAFFRMYALAKRMLNQIQRRKGKTKFYTVERV